MKFLREVQGCSRVDRAHLDDTRVGLQVEVIATTVNVMGLSQDIIPRKMVEYSLHRKRNMDRSRQQ